MIKEEKIFLQMEEELKQYNESYSENQHPRKPKYDKDLFIRFRMWQQKRIAEGRSNE